MGFSENKIKRALLESGNNAEMALNLLIANMDNEEYNLPLETVKKNLWEDIFKQTWEIAQSL